MGFVEGILSTAAFLATGVSGAFVIHRSLMSTSPPGDCPLRDLGRAGAALPGCASCTKRRAAPPERPATSRAPGR
ncbi:MAG TPA: hypothetical protein VEA81_02725 [Burkholderiaceae bacterium]|nr:hypothetical protein [Burkholderiaceae bacterium]